MISGEPSGADFTNYVFTQIKQKYPNARLVAVGDKENPVEGVEYIENHWVFTYYGYVHILFNILSIRRAIARIVLWCKKNRPDLVVLVDAPGLNLRLAPKLRPHTDTIYYFISPKFWARGYERIYDFKRFVDRVFPVFAFEMNMYRHENIPATLVRHPKVDQIETFRQNKEKKNYFHQTECEIVGIFPGSRPAEIDWMLPVFLDTAQLLLRGYRGYHNINFIIGMKSHNVKKWVRKMAKAKLGHRVRIVEDDFYNAAASCDYALCTSGTATLELALLDIPMVVAYKMNRLDTYLTMRKLKVASISLVNLLLGKKIVSECLGDFANPQILSDELQKLFKKQGLYATQLEGFASIRESLLSCQVDMSDQIVQCLQEFQSTSANTKTTIQRSSRS